MPCVKTKDFPSLFPGNTGHADRRVWVRASCVAGKAGNIVLGGTKYQESDLVHGGCRGSVVVEE